MQGFSTFEEWIAYLTAQKIACRVLLVFAKNQIVRGSLERGGDGLLQVLGEDQVVATPSLKFVEIVSRADRRTPGWDVVFLAKAASADGSMPSRSEARALVRQMRDQIGRSGPGELIALCRDGTPLANITPPASGHVH